jgi:glycine cleavage system H protein
MDLPSDYRLLETHEWHKLEGDLVVIGITQFAADELTDITYVALPKVGKVLKANDRFGEIESVKATSDLYSGVAGEIVEVNAALNADAGLVNREPYSTGWMIKVKVTDKGDLHKLLTAADYLKKVKH